MALIMYGALEVWSRTLRLANTGNNVFVVAEILDIQSTRQWVDTWVAEREASKPRVIVAGDVPEEFREELAILARQHNVEVRA
jgi:hypoxanthine-guanine phosphoribosyltransferase